MLNYNILIITIRFLYFCDIRYKRAQQMSMISSMNS